MRIVICSLVLVLVSVVGLASTVRAGDPARSPVPMQVPAHPGLTFWCINAWGAEEWTRNIDGAVMIRIPGGTYLQRPYEGDGTTEKPMPVEVASYFIDKHEVTNDQAARFLTQTEAARKFVSWKGSALHIPLTIGFALVDPKAAPSPADVVVRPAEVHVRTLRERHPVVSLSGEGAVAFATWAMTGPYGAPGARLPTKAEWEKAAGGPKGRVYPWGDATADETRANFGRPTPRGLMPVGSFAGGASPYGAMDMAGNAYERVMHDGHVAMIKGGSWLTPHPLNLRVLDMCMQSPKVADRSVGFRLVVPDQFPDRPTYVPPKAPVLKVHTDMMDAVEEAQERRVPIFLSLQYDTCGQCDRTRAQLFKDPRFVAYCNKHLVVLVGHQSGDAGMDGHKANADDSCPFYPGVACWEHHTIFRQAMKVVGGFQVSPGNFLLHPDHVEPNAPKEAYLVPESGFSKSGNDVAGYLKAFDAGRAKLVEMDAAKTK